MCAPLRRRCGPHANGRCAGACAASRPNRRAPFGEVEISAGDLQLAYPGRPLLRPERGPLPRRTAPRRRRACPGNGAWASPRRLTRRRCRPARTRSRCRTATACKHHDVGGDRCAPGRVKSRHPAAHHEEPRPEERRHEQMLEEGEQQAKGSGGRGCPVRFVGGDSSHVQPVAINRVRCLRRAQPALSPPGSRSRSRPRRLSRGLSVVNDKVVGERHQRHGHSFGRRRHDLAGG